MSDMPEPDYDDPAVEEAWCLACRAEIIAHLDAHGFDYNQVGDWPAFLIAPVVSIWAVESKQWPGKLGWWAFCGDGPTDVISGHMVHDPRAALRALGEHWRESAEYMARGEAPPDGDMGAPEDRQKLAPLLASRAEVFLEWAAADELWEDV